MSEPLLQGAGVGAGGGKRKRADGPKSKSPAQVATSGGASQANSSFSASNASPNTSFESDAQSKRMAKRARREAHKAARQSLPSSHASNLSTGSVGSVNSRARPAKQSTPHSDQLSVEYRCLNGRSWSSALHPKASLADLSYDAAKRAHMQTTGVKLVNKRGIGQEQDIWDDFDLAALRARASANPKAPIVIMVYPAAGPSSAPSSQSSASFDSPPSTPSHTHANDESQDLYFTPFSTPAMNGHATSSTPLSQMPGSDTFSARYDAQDANHHAAVSTPSIIPATPTQPSSSKSVRFSDNATPRLQSTPLQMRPPAHLKHLHQPARPSPLAQSSRADDSDAGSEVDVDLGLDSTAGANESSLSIEGAAAPAQGSQLSKRRRRRQNKAEMTESSRSAMQVAPLKLVAKKALAADGADVAHASTSAVSNGATAATSAAAPPSASKTTLKKSSTEGKAQKAPTPWVSPVPTLARAVDITSTRDEIVSQMVRDFRAQQEKQAAQAALTSGSASSSSDRPSPSSGVPAVAAGSPGLVQRASSNTEAAAATVTPAAKAKKAPRGSAQPAAETDSAPVGTSTGASGQKKKAAPRKSAVNASGEHIGFVEGSTRAAAVVGDLEASIAKKKPGPRKSKIITADDTAKKDQQGSTETSIATAGPTGAGKKKAVPRKPASEAGPAGPIASLAISASSTETGDASPAETAEAADVPVAKKRAPRKSLEAAGASMSTPNASAAATDTTTDTAAPPVATKKTARRKSVVEVEIPTRSPAKTPGQLADPLRGVDETNAADAPSKKQNLVRSKKVVGVELPSPSKRPSVLPATADADDTAGETSEMASAAAPKKRGRNSLANSATDGSVAVESAAESGDVTAIAADDGTVDGVDTAPVKRRRRTKAQMEAARAAAAETGPKKRGRKSAADEAAVPNEATSPSEQRVPNVAADESTEATTTPIGELEGDGDNAVPSHSEGSHTVQLPAANTAESAEAIPDTPISRNERLNAKATKAASKRASCIICGVRSTHMQQNCPIVKAGITGLESRLGVVRADMDGREKELSESAIQTWIQKIKNMPEKAKKAKDRKSQVDVREADTPESEEGSAPVHMRDDTSASEAAGGFSATNPEVATDNTAVIASPEAAGINSAVGDLALPAPTLATAAPAAVADPPEDTPPAASTSSAKKAADTPAPRTAPAATPRASMPNGMPRFGIDDPTETPLPPIFLHNFKKARKQGSISGVSASTAVIETEGSRSGSDSESDSESESGSDSGSSRSSRTSRSSSYAGSADSDGSADRLRVKSVEVDDRIRRHEDIEMGSGAEDEEDDSGEESESEKDAIHPDLALPTRTQVTPVVYRVAKQPNTGHPSDTSDAPDADSDGEEEGSESGSETGSGDGSDNIESPNNMPVPRPAAVAAVDPSDPEAMFKAVFARPLSQVDRAKIKAKAARMSDVHLQPEDEDDDDADSVQSSSEGDKRVRADDESSIGDYGSDAGDDVDMEGDEDIGATDAGQPPVIAKQSESIETAETEDETTPKNGPVPLESQIIDGSHTPPGTPPRFSRTLSANTTPGGGRRRLTELDESAGPSQEVDDMPGALALEEARSEEEEAENDAMQPKETREPSLSQGITESQASPRRTRGSQRVRDMKTASQPSTPARKPTSQPITAKRATRASARVQSATPSASEHGDAEERAPVNSSQAEHALQATPKPKRVASQIVRKTASLQTNGTDSQEDQLDSSSRPASPEPIATPAAGQRRTSRSASSVPASPAQSTRRSTRLRSASADPAPESSQLATQETRSQNNPLFMSQSQPLYTQHYKLVPDSLESEPSSSSAPTPASRKTPGGRRVRPSSPIAEEDESMSTPRANGAHIAESSPTRAQERDRLLEGAEDSPEVGANGTNIAASEADDAFTEGDSFALPPLQLPIAQPKVVPAVSFAPSLGSLNMDQLRRGSAAVAGLLGFGQSASQPAPSGPRSSLPSRQASSQGGYLAMEDSESEADIDSDDEDETPQVGRVKALARYASAKDSASKPKVKTRGRMSGW